MSPGLHDAVVLAADLFKGVYAVGYVKLPMPALVFVTDAKAEATARAVFWKREQGNTVCMAF